MNIYNYIFSYESLVSGTAFHTLEIPFIFGAIGNKQYQEIIKINEKSEQLSKLMMETWLCFARTGDPNHEGLPKWPPYDLDRRSTMILGIPPKIEVDPMAEVRNAWNEIF